MSFLGHRFCIFLSRLPKRIVDGPCDQAFCRVPWSGGRNFPTKTRPCGDLIIVLLVTSLPSVSTNTCGTPSVPREGIIESARYCSLDVCFFADLETLSPPKYERNEITVFVVLCVQICHSLARWERQCKRDTSGPSLNTRARFSQNDGV